MKLIKSLAWALCGGAVVILTALYAAQDLKEKDIRMMFTIATGGVSAAVLFILCAEEVERK